MSGIKIGNSGWSYRDWVGNFYPKGQRSSRFLSRYFTHFDTVEINTTFYDIPGRSMVEGWIKEASRFDGKEFCVKVPRTISHILCMKESPSDMIRAYGEFSEAVLDPMNDAGLLGAVLFQASPYFTFRGDIKYRMKSEPKVPLPEYALGKQRLVDVCAMMAERPGEAAVEFRNSSWLDERSALLPEAVDILRAHGTALVTVDGPSFPWMYADTSRHNYVRFHGRNREAWFKGGEPPSPARYDYLYTREELIGRKDDLLVMSSRVDRGTRVFFNNHPRGQAPRNALMLMELLGLGRTTGSLDGFY